MRKVVADGVLTDSIAASIARTYNLRNCKIVVTPDGNTSPLSDILELDPTHYVDPFSGSTYSLDHLSISTSASDVKRPTDDTRNEIKDALQPELKKYIQSFYVSDPSAAMAYAKDKKVLVVLAGEKVNLRNFWSGKWNSTWTVSFDADNKASISGEVKVHVHYFEDGNLQLATSKRCDSVVLTSASPSTAQVVSKVIDHIKQFEISLQSGLEEMYNAMNNETFKSMRRVMPITREKMAWNINAVRMVRQVRK